MFETDSFKYTHLIQFLWNEYKKSLEDLLKSRKLNLSLEEAIKRVSVTNFVNFASEYLDKNRSVRTFFIDSNLGIQLSNNQTIQLSPGNVVRGSMQESAAIGITDPVDENTQDKIKTSHVDI